MKTRAEYVASDLEKLNTAELETLLVAVSVRAGSALQQYRPFESEEHFYKRMAKKSARELAEVLGLEVLGVPITKQPNYAPAHEANQKLCRHKRWRLINGLGHYQCIDCGVEWEEDHPVMDSMHYAQRQATALERIADALEQLNATNAVYGATMPAPPPRKG